MKIQKTRKLNPHWRNKKTFKSYFPIHTIRPEVNVLPGDVLIAEGIEDNTLRLVQLAHGNVPKLYPSLINNPLLDPDSRYSVVLGILSTPNHVISLRRKYDFLSASVEIHYYREDNKKKLLAFINKLSHELQTLLLKASQQRIDEVKKMKELQYRENREIREIINFIHEMNAFKPSYVVENYSQLFWEVVGNVMMAENQEKSSAPIKHINDVTHSKLTAIWKIKSVKEIGISEFYNSKSHPVIIASMYYARIKMRSSLNVYPEFVRNVYDFSKNYPTYLKLAHERKNELQLLENMRLERLEEARRVKLEEKKRIAAEEEEIERVRRETLAKYPSSGGYSGSGGGNSWGASNNSRYRKGG